MVGDDLLTTYLKLDEVAFKNVSGTAYRHSDVLLRRSEQRHADWNSLLGYSERVSF